MWGSEGSACRVRNRVFDEESNSSTRTRLRSVIPEEGVTRALLRSQRRLGGGKFLFGRLYLVCQFATCMERSVRFEQRPWIFEVHTVKEEGGEEALGAGEGRTRENGGR